MKLVNKLFIVNTSILMSFALPFSFISKKDNSISVSDNEDMLEVAPYNEFNHAYPCYSFDSEPHYSTQNDWTFEAMSLGSITSKYTGKNVKLAIIDSGINYYHEDFKNAGVNVVDSHSMSIEWESGTWKKYKKSAGEEAHLADTNGHGTNVAACVASQINGVGGSGIAPDVDLYIFNAQGYQWGAIQTALNECVTLGVDIVNMSIQAYENSGDGYSGGYDPDSVYGLQDHINSCFNHGITVVAAAGNYNTSEPSYPASYNHVISVGSLAKSSNSSKASYSNTYGIDVVTSGSVYVAGKDNSSYYKETQGTSFSSPLVAAAIALYKEKYPSASPSTIETALKNSCDAISGNPSWAGSGRINVERFLNEDYSLDFTNVEDELEINVGSTYQLEWAFTPNTIANKNVHFDNLDDDVLTVSEEGLITAISEGESIIQIYSDQNYHYYDEVTVTVTNSGPAPTVSSVTISPNTLALDLNGVKTGNLTATVNGDNGPSQAVSWSSNNTSVATVNSSGVVTGVTAGTATITATSQLDNTKSGNCTVTVTDSSGPSDTTQYTLITSTNDLEVGKSYLITNGTSGTIKAMSKTSNTNNRPCVDLTVSSNKLTRGSNALSVTLGGTSGAYTFKTDNYGGTAGYLNATSTTSSNYLQVVSTLDKYANFSIAFSNSQAVITCTGKTSRNIVRYNSSNSPVIFSCYSSGQSPVYLWKEVTTKTLSSISVSNPPTKITYEAGDYFDPTGLAITRTYSDSTSDTYTYSGHTSEFTFSPTTSTALATSNTSVTITYGGKSCNQAITVNVAKTLSSISIDGYTTSFVEGDTFNFGGTVTANYSDGSHLDVTGSATFTGYNLTNIGNQTVTVHYTYKNVERTQTYSVDVTAGILSSISVTGQTTVYQKNASFSFDGTCTATFENGYQKVVTPTSVSSPDMSSSGNKTVTISFTYNGKTKTTTYEITVNAYRKVMEESYSLIGTATFNSSIVVNPNGAFNVSTTGYTTFESSAIRLASGSQNGGLSITSPTSSVYKMVINAKSYGSDANVTLSISGANVSITSTYADYSKEFETAPTSITVSASKNKRAYVKSITLYSKSIQDIGQTEDCVGLETFINNYMHMDYTDNLGYCSDSTHHYYATAKEAFNALNDHQRALFTTNSAYLVEWTRLSTWASKNGDSLNSSSSLVAGRIIKNNITINNDTIIVVLVSIITIGSCLAFFIFKKRKNID